MWHALACAHSKVDISIHQIFRNKAKLQAYQREYARQKRAPGRRKVSKEKRALLEENHLQKCQLLEIEGLGPSPETRTTLLQCVPPLPPSRVPVCWYSYRYQGPTIASLFYAPEMWTPNVIDTRCKMKRMLKNTSGRRKTSFHCCFRISGKTNSKYALTST
jgi:hypothetical protein